jgi:hypothetical protein
VFILKLPKWVPAWIGSSWYGPLYRFAFSYQLNVDSSAMAMLEMSLDSGAHWMNVKDSLAIGFSTNLDSNGFSHSSGWKSFTLQAGSSMWDVADTILFRFTFISDSVISSKDGWMIDDIATTYWFESVPQLENNNLISFYPNPSKGRIYLHADEQTGEASLGVYDMLGRQVIMKDHVPRDGYLDLLLPDGVYTLRYSTEEEYCIKRLIITN